MSFQAYLDTIKHKTGKTPDEFRSVAEAKGLLRDGVKAAEIIAWLKDDYGLGRGHAMAIVDTFKHAREPHLTLSEKIDRHFAATRSRWRPAVDELLAKLQAAGAATTVSPTDRYISLSKGEKKFAIVQVTAERIDVGIKLKLLPTTGRLEDAGRWNSLVTHRVRITDPHEIDDQLVGWLAQAYAAI
jgi:hypothetical protein